MTANRSLYDYYKEYISGNKSALDEMFISERTKAKDNEEGKIRFAVPDLNKMVSSAYSAYQQQGISPNGRYKKYKEGVFKGTRDDMTCVFVEKIIEIFSDSENVIESNEKLYSHLKCNIIQKVNDILENDNSQLEQSVEFEKGHFQKKTNINPNDYDRLSEYSYKKYMQGHTHKSYGSFYRELLGIIRHYDITQMLPANNVVAKNIIALILSDESTAKYDTDKDSVCIDSLQKIADLYKSVYGDDITIEQVSEAYKRIYDMLMRCHYGFVPEKRSSFIKRTPA